MNTAAAAARERNEVGFELGVAALRWGLRAAPLPCGVSRVLLCSDKPWNAALVSLRCILYPSYRKTGNPRVSPVRISYASSP